MHKEIDNTITLCESSEPGEREKYDQSETHNDHYYDLPEVVGLGGIVENGSLTVDGETKLADLDASDDLSQTSEAVNWGGEGRFADDDQAWDAISEFHYFLLAQIDSGKRWETEDGLKEEIDKTKKLPEYLLSDGLSRKSILHIAVETADDTFRGREQFIGLLLKLDAKLPLRKMSGGRTAAFIAMENNKTSIVKFLCEESCEAVISLGMPGVDGKTCLHLALENNRDNVEYLVQKMVSEKIITDALATQDRDGDTPLHIAVDYKRCRPAQIDLVESLVRCSDAALEIKNSRGFVPLTHHQATRISYQLDLKGDREVRKDKILKRDSQAVKKSVQIVEEDASKVENYVKLHCLRTKDRHTARKLLYSNNEKREIEFNLGTRKKITERNLEEMQKHQKFEWVLQHVRIPALEVEMNGDTGPFLKSQPPCAGRRDYCAIFDWLRRQGVTRILKIIVDDLKFDSIFKCHSDGAIETALVPFAEGIEVWKWKRLDISLEVIYKCAPNVEELYLYWGGNSAILWAWSDRGWIEKLTKLKALHLEPDQGLETQERMNRDIEEFGKRVKLICESLQPHRTIQVKLIPSSSGSEYPKRVKLAENVQLDGGIEGGRQWLECMDNFARFMCKYDAELERERKIRDKPQVKVALIDDGIEPFHDELSLNIAMGESWYERPDEEELFRGYHQSSIGHGTAMACLIRRVCPGVQLYVAKLDERVTQEPLDSFTAQSAAVRWAIENAVHIISMSWTITKTKSNSNDLAELEKALSEAAEQNILLFCSMSDEGITDKDRTCPVSFPLRKFNIGAASPTGSLWEQGGDKQSVNYGFPGTNFVFKAEPNQFPVPSSGSSIATALAAGLATMILYCAQTHSPDDFAKLQSHDHMNEAFQAIGINENRYILVWNVFSKCIKELGIGESKSKAIKEIMQILLSRQRLVA